MDTKYHIDLVNNEATNYTRTAYDRELAKKANALYPNVENAMRQLIVDGDYKKYIDSITEYDAFIWEESHRGDKTNIFAYKKIKVSPTWTEQIWAPVFERIRQHFVQKWSVDLDLVQNISVVETLPVKGKPAFKNVDAGISIKKEFLEFQKYYNLPVIVVEMKTGHYCKVACTGVDAIIRRTKSMNSNILAFAITDNNISVGMNAEIDQVWSSGGILIQQRGIGLNQKRVPYPCLSYKNFELVEKISKNYLSTKSPADFLNIVPNNTSGIKLRKHIDVDGYYIPESLVKFINK